MGIVDRPLHRRSRARWLALLTACLIAATGCTGADRTQKDLIADAVRNDERFQGTPPDDDERRDICESVVATLNVKLEPADGVGLKDYHDDKCRLSGSRFTVYVSFRSESLMLPYDVGPQLRRFGPRIPECWIFDFSTDPPDRYAEAARSMRTTGGGICSDHVSTFDRVSGMFAARRTYVEVVVQGTYVSGGPPALADELIQVRDVAISAARGGMEA